MTAADLSAYPPGARVQRIAPNQVGCFDRGVVVEAYHDIREIQWSHGGRVPGVADLEEITGDTQTPDRCFTCGTLIDVENGTAGSAETFAVWCDHCNHAEGARRHYGEAENFAAAFSAAWPGPDIAGAMLGAGYHLRQCDRAHCVPGRAWMRQISQVYMVRVTSRESPTDLPTAWDDVAVTLLRRYFAACIELHDPAPTTIGRLLRQV